MASKGRPRNRKGKRAMAKHEEANPNGKPETLDDIILEQPNRTRPDGKTLFELADERQAELDIAAGRTPKITKIPVEKTDEDGDWPYPPHEPLGPVGDALLYGISLTMLHFTLDVLVYNQYRQSIVWTEIIQRSLTALPILIFVVYVLHPRNGNQYVETGKQLLFLVASVCAGCYLVHSGNRYGYYAVMKRAPPLGTLWVWSVVEMQLPHAVVGLAAVASYTWWYGYTVF